MSDYIKDLTEAVKKIKSDGWHDSTRKGNTGIGKTFEDLLDKEEDNIDAPDYFDIEIKTHETASASMLTLFTKSPSGPTGANTLLRQKYGKKDEASNKILHITISGNRKTKTVEYGYNYKINVDRKNEIIYLSIYNKADEEIDNSVYWTFKDLSQQISKKLETIAIISAESRVFGGKKQYKYNEIDIVTNLTVDNLIHAIETGDLKIDIRIGAYRSGKNAGKTHDHGTGFRINVERLLKYADVKRIQ